jgi:hypothetical protein
MAVNHVNGGMYMVYFVNASGTTSTAIGITGNTYDPTVLWAMAEGLIPCIKQFWFAPDDVVTVDRIESHGEILTIENPN